LQTFEAIPGLPAGETIRAMRQADLAAVHALECASQPDPWTRQHFADELANPVAAVDLYWCGAELAGYLCSWLIAGELQVQNLATAPRFRCRGIAARLLGHVIARGRDRGLEAVCLEVRAGNAAAIALYERFGFVAGGRRKAYYPDGEDALLMTYQLSGDVT